MFFGPQHWLRLCRWTPPGRRNLLATVVLTGALAITSALFAIVDALWLRPLPFVQPEKLVWVARHPNPAPAPAPIAEVVEALASDPRIVASAEGREGPLSERYSFNELEEGGLYNYRVTPSFFRMLGVAPALGRAFVDDDAAHADIVPALIAHSIWQSRWGGAPDIVGRVVSLGSTRVEIVGVMPAGFTFPFGATLWTPLTASGEEIRIPSLPLFARLAEHASPAELARAYPQLDVVPLEDYYRPQRHAAVTFIVVGSAVLFVAVLLNLLSLRAVDLTRRMRDQAIRRSLGATPGQLALETGARVAGLAAVALAIGWVAVPPLMRLAAAQLPPELFRHTEAIYSWRTVAGAVVLAVAGALAYHWPVLSRRRGGSADRQAIVRHGLPSHALSTTCLVAAGAALAYVAALATVTATTLERADLGFEPTNVLEVSFPRRLPGDEDDSRETGFQHWLDVRDLPGVVSAALAFGRPLQPAFLTERAQAVGNPACQPARVRVNYVTPEYFRTIGVPLREGEAFASPLTSAPAESSTTAPGFGLQAAANEALMRQWRECGAALGTRIQLAVFSGTIVAIAADTIDRDPRERPEPQVYLPTLRDSGTMLLVRHEPGTARDERLLREHLARMFPGANVTPLGEDVARARRADRSRALALQLFSGLSILLAALGLLAGQSARLDHRRRELALRMALGAGVPHLRRRVVLPGVLGAMAGGPIGVLIGIACGRIGESLFVGVSAVYVPGMVIVPVGAALIAVGVALYGARAVARISPASVLNETT